ncbi:VQ motif-containing protein 4-like isoform X1 [Ipomoea triloba]|uniref:VQ motif-containing protein 4-like isoform X1 n=1 Tax=Ipomoea triloba TaxID=35885 RepID=UPI00125D9BFE|nr:VQ motif-containing protein 4-like isoform X1 [Ipomoea triloba]XP_031128330.1 VQ motif-containing protein 4-like isoform X1 [Ipomoea triloba]
MERPQENHSAILVSSPDNRSANSSSSTVSGNGPAILSPPAAAAVQQPPQAAPVLPVTRSEPNNLYPTTFVQADTSSFKQVVQMLTGLSETAKQAALTKPEPARNPIPPIKTGPRKEKSASKLYERRNSLKNFKISPLGAGLANKPGFGGGFSGSPRFGTPEILSPSILDFPSLVLSPVTPLIPDPFNRSPHSTVSADNLNMEAEEKAIAKKGFYLHPSPANTPRDAEPRLLPLFPVTSPRVSGGVGMPNE